MIDAKDILEWCYVVGALDFGVFGFLYSVYATAMFTDGAPPPIVGFLRSFCRIISTVLLALTLVAAVETSLWLSEHEFTFVGLSIVVFLASLAVLTGYAIYLAFKKMR